MHTTEKRKQELAQTEAAVADSVQRMVLLLAETLAREAEHCKEAARNNPTPYGEAFDAIRITLDHLASVLRSESEKQENSVLIQNSEAKDKPADR